MTQKQNKENEIENFMKQTLDFLIRNKCLGINRNIIKDGIKYYVMIEFRESKFNNNGN